MSVTVDHEPLNFEPLGLTTVGQILSHVQRDNRLVVNLLIDGQEPDLDELSTVRRSPLSGKTLFIETADPRQMAVEVIDEIQAQIDEAERLSTEAIALLHKNSIGKAMEKLSGCFSTWQHAHDSVRKTGQLLRIDLNLVQADSQTLAEVLEEFSGQLKQIKHSLEARDYLTLTDILTYETTHTSTQWRVALNAMRDVVLA